MKDGKWSIVNGGSGRGKEKEGLGEIDMDERKRGKRGRLIVGEVGG